jgi:hypothetical protein
MKFKKAGSLRPFFFLAAFCFRSAVCRRLAPQFRFSKSTETLGSETLSSKGKEKGAQPVSHSRAPKIRPVN